jgi:hypothetical protein
MEDKEKKNIKRKEKSTPPSGAIAVSGPHII